jgi:DNA ligase-1
LLRDYLGNASDPERGWALASLTGALRFDAAKPAFIRKAAEARLDPQLFALSYDFVGDLAETVALVWPAKPGANREPELPEVVESLRSASRREVPQLLERWLDALDATGRWALLKLLTGGLRVGVSARLAKQALAAFGAVPIGDIEEVWHGQDPPYGDLFAWLEKRSEKPSTQSPARFRPVMLAQAIDEAGDFARYAAADYAAEWKWDGIRVQAAHEGGQRRLYSRSGEDIAPAFPDVMAALEFEGDTTPWMCSKVAGTSSPVQQEAVPHEYTARGSRQRANVLQLFSRKHVVARRLFGPVAFCVMLVSMRRQRIDAAV